MCVCVCLRCREVDENISQNGLRFSNAKQCPEGIRIQPVAANDCRGLTRSVDSLKHDQHTSAVLVMIA